jgi:hypothetical protein
MLVAGILFVGAGERERIRPALWIVLAVYAYSCIANLISMSAQMKMMSEGVPVPVSNIVGVVIYALSNLSIALVAAIALFAPHNRSAIRGSAMVAMVAGGLRLVVWISTIRISGMERLSEIFTLTYATSTIGWILLAWTLFSRKEMPVAGGSSIATAPKEPAKQATPIPTAPGKPEPAKQEAPKTGDNLNSEQKFIAEAVVSLMRLYHNSPGGEGFLTGSQSAEPVRQIGERLYARGGHQFMVVAHQLFASSYTVMGAARNLESVWDGIGDWMG